MSVLLFFVFCIGPGLLAGMAVVHPRIALCPALIVLTILECGLWTRTTSPESELAWIFSHMILVFSTAFGLYCGLLLRVDRIRIRTREPLDRQLSCVLASLEFTWIRPLLHVDRLSSPSLVCRASSSFAEPEIQRRSLANPIHSSPC